MPVLRASHHFTSRLRQYERGVRLLRDEGRYHKYVWWHAWAVANQDNSDKSPGPVRNIAHFGPTFLPWHREFLHRLENELQQVLGDPDFGIPYWHWVQDEAKGGPHVQAGPHVQNSTVWNDLEHVPWPNNATRLTVLMGGTYWPRMSLKFVLSLTAPYLKLEPVDLGVLTIRSIDPAQGSIIAVADGDEASTYTGLSYDTPDYNSTSTDSFRNLVESGGHGAIHNIVGGDMGSAALAVNDPIFFLHHAMVDRIWARWQDKMLANGGARADHYAPQMNTAQGIQEGHRIDEPMLPWSNPLLMGLVGLPAEDVTPRMVLDHRASRLNYVYDDQAGGIYDNIATILEGLFGSSS